MKARAILNANDTLPVLMKLLHSTQIVEAMVLPVYKWTPQALSAVRAASVADVSD